MWGGGRLRFAGSLRAGEPVVRTSRRGELRQKMGRSGPFALLTVYHHIASQSGEILEEQDLVFKAPPVLGAATNLSEATDRSSATDQARLVPDEVMLFRFSALTGNAHRIHYDIAYAQGVEAYPKLVVHGPLQAMLLAALAERLCPQRGPMRSFRFRAGHPAYCSEELRLCARISEDRAGLATRSASGALLMEAEAILG